MHELECHPKIATDVSNTPAHSAQVSRLLKKERGMYTAMIRQRTRPRTRDTAHGRPDQRPRRSPPLPFLETLLPLHAALQFFVFRYQVAQNHPLLTSASNNCLKRAVRTYNGDLQSEAEGAWEELKRTERKRSKTQEKCAKYCFLKFKYKTI